MAGIFFCILDSITMGLLYHFRQEKKSIFSLKSAVSLKKL